MNRIAVPDCLIALHRRATQQDSAMKTIATLFAVAAITLAATAADAKGCLKGAVVGGVAGHYAGHHAVIGATAGCALWPPSRQGAGPPAAGPGARFARHRPRQDLIVQIRSLNTIHPASHRMKPMTPPQQRAGDRAQHEAGAAEDQRDDDQAERAVQDADVGHGRHAIARSGVRRLHFSKPGPSLRA